MTDVSSYSVGEVIVAWSAEQQLSSSERLLSDKKLIHLPLPPRIRCHVYLRTSFFFQRSVALFSSSLLSNRDLIC